MKPVSFVTVVSMSGGEGGGRESGRRDGGYHTILKPCEQVLVKVSTITNVCMEGGGRSGSRGSHCSKAL